MCRAAGGGGGCGRRVGGGAGVLDRGGAGAGGGVSSGSAGRRGRRSVARGDHGADVRGGPVSARGDDGTDRAWWSAGVDVGGGRGGRGSDAAGVSGRGCPADAG